MSDKPEPHVWLAYRLDQHGMLSCFVRTSEKDALRLAVDHDLRVAHVARSADLVEAVRDE